MHKAIPAPVMVPLHSIELEAAQFDHHFHYLSVIGKLNKARDQTLCMPYISVPTSLQLQKNHMPKLSNMWDDTSQLQ